MSIRTAFRHYLGTLTDLTDLVQGSGEEARIFPVLAPQGTAGRTPRVRYLRQSDSREPGRDLSDTGDRIEKGTVRFILFLDGLTYDDCALMEQAIRGAGNEGPQRLDGYDGIMGDTGDQYYVTARIDDASDNASEPAHGEETWTFLIQLDVTINYQKTGG